MLKALSRIPQLFNALQSEIDAGIAPLWTGLNLNFWPFRKKVRRIDPRQPHVVTTVHLPGYGTMRCGITRGQRGPLVAEVRVHDRGTNEANG